MTETPKSHPLQNLLTVTAGAVNPSTVRNPGVAVLLGGLNESQSIAAQHPLGKQGVLAVDALRGPVTQLFRLLESDGATGLEVLEGLADAVIAMAPLAAATGSSLARAVELKMEVNRSGGVRAFTADALRGAEEK
jgi:hypothetical protein